MSRFPENFILSLARWECFFHRVSTSWWDPPKPTTPKQKKQNCSCVFIIFRTKWGYCALKIFVLKNFFYLWSLALWQSGPTCCIKRCVSVIFAFFCVLNIGYSKLRFNFNERIIKDNYLPSQNIFVFAWHFIICCDIRYLGIEISMYHIQRLMRLLKAHESSVIIHEILCVITPVFQNHSKFKAHSNNH